MNKKILWFGVLLAAVGSGLLYFAKETQIPDFVSGVVFGVGFGLIIVNLFKINN